LSLRGAFRSLVGRRNQEAGIVGAALAHAEYVELVPDSQHVYPGAALRAIPRQYGITNATSATGMPNGEYGPGSQLVPKDSICAQA
jgi:N-acetylglucosamine-6-phosphate deacetylase